MIKNFDEFVNEMYSSHNTEENYTEIDAIGGATLTTDGYKQAIERAFTAVKTLNGGEL